MIIAARANAVAGTCDLIDDLRDESLSEMASEGGGDEPDQAIQDPIRLVHRGALSRLSILRQSVENTCCEDHMSTSTDHHEPPDRGRGGEHGLMFGRYHHSDGTSDCTQYEGGICEDDEAGTIV